MANKHLLYLVILSLVSSSKQDVTNNQIEEQEESPLADITKEILKEKNLENLGGMVNSFIQSGGAKTLMDGVLQNLATKENGGQLLESLGNMLNSAASDSGGTKERETKKTNDEINPMELLSGLGSIMGTMQGNNDQANPAALLQGIGSILGGLNNAGGNNGNGGAALLQGIGSLLANANVGNNDDNNAGAVLQGLSSVLGGAAAAGGQQDGAGALLQGLGSLFGGGQAGGQGLDPQMIGNMINMFASAQQERQPTKSKAPKKVKASSKPKKGQKGEKTKKFRAVSSLLSSFLGGSDLDLNFLFDNFPLMVKMGKTLAGPELKKYIDPVDDIIFVYNEIKDKESDVNFGKLLPKFLNIHRAYQELVAPHFKLMEDKSGGDEQPFDLSGLWDIASNYLSQDEKGKKEGSNFMDYLPVIMNTINSFTGPEAQQRADSHASHAWAMPPILERIHIYFDNFINSDMGKMAVEYIGDQKAFKVFQDENGEFNYNKFKELLENHSFRRHWIQQVTEKLVEFLRVVSDETTQKRYVDMGLSFTNSFLKNSGFPKKALLDMKAPVKSITNFANFVAKKYLDADIDTKEYVEPIVLYTKDLLKMARASLKPGPETQALTDKLTDTINMEIIEPITRVNRAYRFAKSEPHCDRYVFCVINQNEPTTSTLPNIKKNLYKGYSLIASWFLSSRTGTAYWDLFDAVAYQENCQVFHNDSCNRFYEEEVRVTTEYIHNEL